MITNGEVSFMRRVKTGEYEHKEAAVKLSFNVQDNEDHVVILGHVFSLALARVYETLGIKTSAPVAEAPKPAETKRPPGRPPADKKPEVKTDPAAVTDETTTASPIVEQAKAAAADPASVTDDDFTSVETAISDKDLTDACTKAAQRLGGPTKIKILIGDVLKKTLGRGGAVAEIPAAYRKLFIEDLKKLTP